jgi:hypothetical protein
LPYQFLPSDEVTQARQRKQDRRLKELHFAWKTAAESRLFAALEYVILFEEIWGLDPGEDFDSEPARERQPPLEPVAGTQ